MSSDLKSKNSARATTWVPGILPSIDTSPAEILLSIVTVCRNDLSALRKTTESVWSQERGPFEHIVIDGGSTDGTREFLEANTDRFSFWVSEPDSGIYQAMNKGAQASKGKYLIFLNAGDVFESVDTLRESLPKIRHSEKIIYGRMRFMELSGFQRMVGPPMFLSWAYLIDHYLCHPSTFIPRQIFLNLGGYNEGFRIVSDWEFVLRCFGTAGVKFQKTRVIVSRFAGGGVSSRPETQQLVVDEKRVALSSLRGKTIPERLVDRWSQKNSET